MAWVAVGFGVLDVSGSAQFVPGIEVIVVPIRRGEPLALMGEGAALWRRMVESVVLDSELNPDERVLAREMADAGVVDSAIDHPARVRLIERPWMQSPLHELVYSMVQNIASDRGIQVLFIKGPVLHKQGLREREHSGDVDIWVDPSQRDELVLALASRGWRVQPYDFVEKTAHSRTLTPEGWGCEIDVHFRFPGIGADPHATLAVLQESADSYLFAGTRGLVPAKAVHAILMALHFLRPTPGQAIDPSAEARAVKALSAGGQIPVVRAALELQSIDVLRPQLIAAFPGIDLPLVGGGIPNDWAWRLQPTRLGFYREVLKSMPLCQRASALWKAVWPTRSRVLQSSADAGQPSASVYRARVERFRRGLRQLGR